TNGGTTTSVCVVPLRYASAVCGCAGYVLRGGREVEKLILANVTSEGRWVSPTWEGLAKQI
ncbi:MAG: hypothetical protein ACKERF_01520, partial [Candidatus Hodgkinia cicadicola]